MYHLLQVYNILPSDWLRYIQYVIYRHAVHLDTSLHRSVSNFVAYQYMYSSLLVDSDKDSIAFSFCSVHGVFQNNLKGATGRT